MLIEDIIDETILIGAKSMTGFDDDDIDELDYLEEDDPLRKQWESARNTVIDKISETLLNLQEQYKARQKWNKSEKKFLNQNDTVSHSSSTDSNIPKLLEFEKLEEEMFEKLVKQITPITQKEKKIDDISAYIPRIWTSAREWMWFEKAWEILDKYNMTSYKNFVEQGQVILRAVTLAMMYIDFCKEAFDEWYGYEDLFETFERSFLDYDREIMGFLYAQLSSEEEYPGFEDAIYELTDDERPKILKVLHKEMSYSIMCYGLYCTGLSEDFYLFYSEDDYDDNDDDDEDNYRCNLINIDDCESYWKSIDENSSKIDNEFYNSAEFDNLMAGYSWLKNSYAERLDYDTY